MGVLEDSQQLINFFFNISKFSFQSLSSKKKGLKIFEILKKCRIVKFKD